MANRWHSIDFQGWHSSYNFIGPFVETKEHLGGFILIDARDLNEAVQLATNCPLAELGSIEVRPIMELSERPLARMPAHEPGAR